MTPKPKFIALIGLCTLIGCTPVKGQRTIKQATYVLGSAARIESRGWAPDRIIPIPKPADITLHLEVIALPDGQYDLHGWMKVDRGSSHSTALITHGAVSTDGMPVDVTWQSSTMGVPNWKWFFSFPGAGHLVVGDPDHHLNYYFHQQD